MSDITAAEPGPPAGAPKPGPSAGAPARGPARPSRRHRLAALEPLLWIGPAIALIASSLVPYVRAKAESLGVSATVGPGPREARIVILLVGLLAWAAFGENELYIAAVAVLAALAIVTFVQRVAHVAARLEDTKEGT